MALTTSPYILYLTFCNRSTIDIQVLIYKRPIASATPGEHCNTDIDNFVLSRNI